VKVLDHGYLTLVEHWGSDERIVEAARMSTDGAFRGWGPRCRRCNLDDLAHMSDCPALAIDHVPGDEKLLRYLYEHKHATPFEMAGAVIEVQAPIFVLREWHRHRTQSYNELSARYTPLPNVNYLPTVDRCVVVPGANKQARGAVERVPTNTEVFNWLEDLGVFYRMSEDIYQEGLSIGIPKEVARCAVTVSRYTRMRASANLRNWLAFLTLRQAPDAQWEIRQFADALAETLRPLFPRTFELFEGEKR
jgi:thymidylate synthase (FAD)